MSEHGSLGSGWRARTLIRLTAWIVLVVACAITVATASSAAAQSQASTGQVSGRAFDSSGAVMPGVIVTISSLDTGVRREVVTNGRGLYVIPLLPAGLYDLSGTASGFRSVTKPGLRVTVGTALTVDLPMLIEQLSETVAVTTSTPPIEVTALANGAIVDVMAPVTSTTFDTTFIEQLPTNGRRFQDLVVLTPKAQLEIQRGQIVLSGQRGINSNISIDGTDYNQPFFGGIRGGSRSNFAPTIPQEAFASSRSSRAASLPNSADRQAAS